MPPLGHRRNLRPHLDTGMRQMAQVKGRQIQLGTGMNFSPFADCTWQLLCA